MKKIYIFAITALSLSLVSCTKEMPDNGEGESFSFSAVAESPTKTYFSGNDIDGYFVAWEVDDKIRLQGEKAAALTLSSGKGEGTSQAIFTTNVGPKSDHNPSYEVLYPAYYPLGSGTALSITSQNANVNQQKYKVNGPEFYPMYARTNEENLEKLEFSNVLGVIRLRLTNTGSTPVTVKSLEFTANKALIGTWSYAKTDDGHYKAELKSGKTPLTLDCGEGVTVAPGVTVPFFVSAFDSEYTALSFNIADVNGKVMSASLKAGKTFKVTRSAISDIALPISAANFTSSDEIRYEAGSDEILVKYPAGASFSTKAASNSAETSITVASHSYDPDSKTGVIKFTSNVTVVGYQTFQNMTSLTSVILPNSVTTIGQNSFTGCTALTAIMLPQSVKTLNSFAFDGCSNLSSVRLSSAIGTISQAAFRNCFKLTTISLPSSVKIINTSAFEGTGIESVSIPEGATTIGASAFLNCKSLVSAVLPNTVTSLGNNAFQNCEKLTTVNIPENPSVVKLPQNLFNGCKALVTVGIPANVTQFGTQVFYNCENLVSADVSNVVSFDANGGQFYGCKKLDSIVFNEAVTEIPKTICKGCTSITSVTIPANVLTIGHQAFNTCSNLEYVYFNRYVDSETYPATVTSRLVSATTYNVDQFSSCPKLLQVGHMFVPQGSLDAYKSAWTWEETWGSGTYKGSYANYFVER